jgi:hypothetical protein
MLPPTAARRRLGREFRHGPPPASPSIALAPPSYLEPAIAAVMIVATASGWDTYTE